MAAPGPEPRVFDAPDVEQLPEGPLRSVGTIEVTAHASDSAADVARRAAAHGRQVGCSILVEQEAFRRIGPRSTLLHGARFELACAVHGNLRHAPPPPHRTISFECVVVGGLATTRA
ncbi:MAG: hypothetical protein SFX73_03940 [Kofleriaceae bacterium]|nr:hypothetical protein [Kofleriaceae bacterium]